MERLTKRLEDGQAVMDCAACGVSWHKKRKKDIPYCTALFCRNRLKERLAAYEDTGLEPEEIKDNMEMFRAYRHICAGHEPEHIRDLLQAEKDGRLVVLPCKVGDTVYGHNKTEVSEYRISVISLAIFNWYLRCQNQNSDFWVTDADIGRTVFLTREEAEAALSGKVSAPPDAPEETAEPEWKSRVMRTFLGGR